MIWEQRDHYKMLCLSHCMNDLSLSLFQVLTNSLSYSFKRTAVLAWIQSANHEINKSSFLSYTIRMSAVLTSARFIYFYFNEEFPKFISLYKIAIHLSFKHNKHIILIYSTPTNIRSQVQHSSCVCIQCYA